MAKRKKQTAFNREHIRKHLQTVHPFLKNKYRKLKATELDSEEVFRELFGAEKFEPYKLRAIYEYQL